jgi:cytoskeletal protein RodZ
MPAVNTPGGIGAALREARERRGLSLRQIAATTRISTAVLERLERNDISRLPGGIFSRAFVRAYAQEVGLDPEQIVRDFIAQFPTETVTEGHPAVRPVEDRQATESAERIAWTIGALSVVAIPLAATVMFMSGGAGSSSDQTSPADSRLRLVEAAPLPAKPVTVLVGPPPGVTSLAESSGPVLLSLVASGPCWVSVTVDGEIALERLLRAGDRASFEVDRAFAIKAGNAGVLALALDGREVRALGATGEVVSISASRDDFDDFLASP